MKEEQKKLNFPSALAGFNYRKISDQYLLVNDWGDYIFLEHDEFAALAAGKPDKKSRYWQKLEKNNFVRKGLDVSGLIRRYHGRKSNIFTGPGLHIMTVTARRGKKEKGPEMSEETARRALDIVFRTTSPHIALEFRGGETLLNWPVVKYIIEEARRRNKKAKKELTIRLVTGGGALTPATAGYLKKKKVEIRFSPGGKDKVLREGLAAEFLEKIAGKTGSGYLVCGSPCGAGTGRLAYNYNGDVYTCEEGRILAEAGDKSFKLGNVKESSYEDLVTSPATKTLCAASCVEALPGCELCVYRPFCGVCPVYNYHCHGNIFAPAPNNERCLINKGVLDCLFAKLADPVMREEPERWVK